MSKWAVICSLYAGMSLLTYTGCRATRDYECHHEWISICDARLVRKDAFMCAAFAATPPGWVVGFMVTYGYQDGFALSGTVP